MWSRPLHRCNPARTFNQLDEAFARIVQRIQWNPELNDAETTIVTCIDGKIARIDRTATR